MRLRLDKAVGARSKFRPLSRDCLRPRNGVNEGPICRSRALEWSSTTSSATCSDTDAREGYLAYFENGTRMVLSARAAHDTSLRIDDDDPRRWSARAYSCLCFTAPTSPRTLPSGAVPSPAGFFS